jgi:UDP-GlcNAc:undecaprenyl-phosphate GlcNAc-1-phosphate transferase
MGDCGSMLVGLVVGVLAITSSLKGPATVALLAPLTVLIIPIFDTTAAIVRRKLTGRSVYTTDRGHIHHCMLRSGLSVPRVLLVVSGLCLVASGGVWASLLWQNELLALLAAATVVLILMVGRLFGHAEAALVHQRLLGMWAAFRGRKAHELAVRLQGSAEWNALWQTLTASASEMNLQTLHLDLNVPALHEGYHARWDRFGGESEVPVAWRAEIPLVVGGQIAGRLVVTGPRDDNAIGAHMAVVARLATEVECAVEHVTESLRHTLAVPPSPVGGGGPLSRPSFSIDRAVG